MDQAEKLRNVVKEKNQSIKQGARVIAITGGKGGVGKTSIAVNLAVWMQKMGKRVIIFDADFGLANVEVMFGTVPKYNLSDLIYHEKSMQEILTEGPLGIGCVSGGSGVLGMNNLTGAQRSYLIRSMGVLDEMADIILIDTGAGIADNVLDFVLASPEVLVVITPDPGSLTDSYSLLKVLYHHTNFKKDYTTLKVAVNRAVSNDEARNVFEKLNSVSSKFLNTELDYIGMIPQDPALERAIRQQKPVSLQTPTSNASRAFELMASNLLNDEHREIRFRGGVYGGFSQFLSWFLSEK